MQEPRTWPHTRVSHRNYAQESNTRSTDRVTHSHTSSHGVITSMTIRRDESQELHTQGLQRDGAKFSRTKIFGINILKKQPAIKIQTPTSGFNATYDHVPYVVVKQLQPSFDLETMFFVLTIDDCEHKVNKQ